MRADPGHLLRKGGQARELGAEIELRTADIELFGPVTLNQGTAAGGYPAAQGPSCLCHGNLRRRTH